MDTSIIYRIAGLGLVCWGSHQFLKQTGRETLAPLVDTAGLVVGMTWVVQMLYQLLSDLQALAQF